MTGQITAYLTATVELELLPCLPTRTFEATLVPSLALDLYAMLNVGKWPIAEFGIDATSTVVSISLIPTGWFEFPLSYIGMELGLATSDVTLVLTCFLNTPLDFFGCCCGTSTGIEWWPDEDDFFKIPVGVKRCRQEYAASPPAFCGLCLMRPLPMR